MIDELAQKIMDEIFPHLETIETQTTALLEYLKDRGLATDEDLAPYLDQAGRASNVRWLTTRLRIEHVLSQVKRDLEKPDEAKPAPPQQPDEKADAVKEMTRRNTEPAQTEEQEDERPPKEAA